MDRLATLSLFTRIVETGSFTRAADGLDIRIGGGVTVLRDFLAAGLVDHLHVVVVPIILGRGVRLWDGLERLEDSYRVEATAAPSGVTHLTFTRRVS